MNNMNTIGGQEGDSGSVAVIGIGCRYPGGVADVASYWSLLMNCRTGIGEVPADRWNMDIFYSPDTDTRGKSRTRWGGFLGSEVFAFDPGFFDISPREAITMDPQQRLLLQATYEAIQDAGMRVSDLRAGKTGVFVGMSTNDYTQRQVGGRPDIFTATGSAYSIASNRISHRFDLHGPSMTIDTACSSGLVAIDRAVNSILSGDCELALAGGVNCMFDITPFVAFSSANMLSPSGAIYTFDSRANGFVRGEGCGILLLKPLAKAVADGDRIYGVVRQTGVNQDGHTVTITSPSGDAQEAMLRELAERSGIDPHDVGYVEAHGTGTQVGDPIEAVAIGRVFGEGRASPAFIGSSKPNIGHLESGAGAAGFIKALLTVYHGLIPPNYNFAKPNPAIPFDALGLRVPTEAVPFPTRPGRPRIAVVNSFGFGGTNSSAIVAQWQPATGTARRRGHVQQPALADAPLVVPLSAGTRNGLALWAGCLAEEIKSGTLAGEAPATVAHALWGRDHFAERAALVIPPETPALVRALTALAQGQSLQEGPEGASITQGHATGSPRLAYAFSGQGGQWWGMGRQLLTHDPIYRRTTEVIDEALRPLTGWSLVEELMRDEDTSLIHEADRTQGAIFASQVGLYEMWKARGLRPELLVGHSFGEIAVGYVSGMIDLDTAARIIAARGRIPQHTRRRGAMAAIGLTAEQIEPFLPQDGSVVFAAFNGPVSQTVTGIEDSVLHVMRQVSAQYPDALVRRLNMNFAWHSPMLDDCVAAFTRDVGEIRWSEPRIPVVSTVTGVLLTRFDSDYLWQNLRQPVSYTRAIRFCLDYGIDSFLELGPHRTVTPLISGIAQDAEKKAVVISSLDRKRDDFWSMASAEAALFTRGISFPAPEGDERGDWQKLPKMPWDNQTFDALSPLARHNMFDTSRHPLLGKRDLGPDPKWTNELLLPNYKFIGDHKVNGDCLFPAVGYLEVMGAALRDHHGDGPVEIRDFRIHEALSLASDDVVEMKTDLDPRTGRLRIHTQHQGAGDGWRLRAEAYGWRHDYALPKRSDEAMAPQGARSSNAALFYKFARAMGLEYGRQFQTVETVWQMGDGATRARVRREPDEVSAPYYTFPALFDGIVQASVAATNEFWQVQESDDIPASEIALPVGMRRVLMPRPLGNSMWVGARRADAGAVDRAYDFHAVNDEGDVVIQVEGLQTRRLGSRASKAGDEGGEVFCENIVALTTPVASELPERLSWLLVSDNDTTAATLTAALEQRGAKVERADIKMLSDFDTAAAAGVVSNFCMRAGEGAGILFAADGGASALREDSVGAELLEATQAISNALVIVAQQIHGLPAGVLRPKIAVVTELCRYMPDDPLMRLASVAGSSTIGLVRTIGNEIPESRTLLIDVDQDALRDAGELARLIVCDGPEPEYVLRKGICHGVRIEKVRWDELVPARRLLSLADPNENFRVTMSSPGVIDNIRLREAPCPQPGELEVVVEVAAVGLNFRDVMAATSILPDELAGEAAYWNNLGLEFSGTVRDVGAGVKDFRPGDRVMGMGKGFLRRYALTRAETLMRVPDTIDLKAAASMPVAYLTAHYSLREVGRLEAGERALIHLASGGVGLAAIEVCRHVGAEIFATAGTDEKRSYLRGLGIEHIMNSRNLDFAREVKAATGGVGVDVVLNALSGAGIDKSLECLAPLGRMVEIGKRDLADDKPIGLKSLYWNNSYSVVDLSTLPQARPKLMARLMAEVEALIAAGAYRPLNSSFFPVSSAAEAMRTLAKARHIGKVVVTFDEPELMVEQDIARPVRLRSDAAYLVTGGLKGFGTQIGAWLSASGAGKVILANRSGKPDAEAAELIKTAEERGTIIECAALDVTDAAAVDALIRANAGGRHPLRGIFHAAAVIEDAFITQLNQTRIERVLAPKVAGAQNLERAVRSAGVELDYCVYFSSIAQLVGSAGQANYTAANSVLNAFADYRLSAGGKANAVAWGMISGSGFVSRSEALGNYLESMGIKAVADTDAAAALGSLMRCTATYASFAKVDWQAVMRAVPAVSSNPRLRPVLERGEGGRSRIQSELMNLPRSEWEGVLDQLIRGEVARVLKTDAAAITVDKKLTELGLDSLSSFELKNRVEALVEVSIPVARFLQAPTIAGLSKLVANSFEAKLKADEQARRSGAEGGTAAQASASLAFRPLTRQLEALQRAGLPMTSSLAAADLVMQIEATASAPIETLSERLQRMTKVHDALRLAAVQRPDGAMAIDIADVPVLSDADGEIVLPGPLWRFERHEDDAGQALIVIKAHRAAADAQSVERVLRQLLGTEDIPDTAVPLGLMAQALEAAEETPQRVRDLAYWREMLRHAPSVIKTRGRRRAAAPAGFGLNRGELLILTRKLSARSGHPSEDQILAAYATALGKLLDAERLVIERHCRSGGAPATGIGPITGSYPLVVGAGASAEAVATLLKTAARHASVDVAAIEAVMAEDLRKEAKTLRQFGFALVEEGTAQLEPVPPSANEVLLMVARTGSSLTLSVVVDSDAVPEHFGASLLDALVALLGGSSAGVSTVTKGKTVSATTVSGGVQASTTKHPAPQNSADHVELPVTANQRALLAALTVAGVESPFNRNFLLSRAFKVTPQADIGRLSTMLGELIKRHEALRTCFIREPDGAIKARLQAQAPAPMIAIEEADDMAIAEERARALAKTPLDPFKDELLQMNVIRVGRTTDIVIVRGHHVVMDGYSVGLLVEELIQLYLGFALQPVGITTREFIDDIDLTYDPEACRRRDDHLAAVFAEPMPQLPKFYRPGYVRQPGPPAFLARAIFAKPDQAKLAALLEQWNAANLTLTAVLAAAYAQMIADRGGVEDVIIVLPSARRYDARLRNYVNWVSTGSFVRVSARRGGLLDVARNIGETLAQQVLFAPSRHIQWAGDANDRIAAQGSYSDRFSISMISGYRAGADAFSSQLQKSDTESEIDFGSVKIGTVRGTETLQYILDDLDLRSFAWDDGTGLMLMFNSEAFTEETAVEMFRDVLDRLGLGSTPMEIK